MTTLAVAAATLTLATLLVLLRPLLRRRRSAAASRAEFDLRIYRDQLAEVDRDVARGLIDATQAEQARIEVKRRMLAAIDLDPAADPATAIADAGPEATSAAGDGAVRRRRSTTLAALLAVLLPLAAGGVYLRLGQPTVPDLPLAERGAADPTLTAGDRTTVQDAVVRLQQRLEARPDDVEGWYLLGRGQLALGHAHEAAVAFERAVKLAPQEPELARAHAEALIAATGGRIDAIARAALVRLQDLDPLSPQARFLLALDRAQQGDLGGAMQGWTDLIALSPADAPWLPEVRRYLQQAGEKAGIDPASLQPSESARMLARARDDAAAGPTAEDMAAAAQMTPEQRAEMIRGMVEGLAARLTANPDDLEGWRRLAHAYRVLGETDKAAEADARVAALEAR